MTANTFAGTLYPNRFRMLDAIAAEWWTAGGLNGPSTIDDFDQSDAAVRAEAHECVTGWDLGDVTEEELAVAMRDFLTNRPDRT